MARAPALELLCEFDFNWGRMGNPGLQALAASPHLGNLSSLSFEACSLSDRGILALAAASLGRLRKLNLHQNTIEDAGIAALVDSPLCDNLTNLSAGQNAFGDDGFRAIAESARLGKLRELALRLPLGRRRVVGGSLGGTLASARALLSSRALTSLEHLDLRRWELPGIEIASALHDLALPRLKRLHLDENPVGDAGARELANCEPLRQLEHLALDQCQIGDAGALVLAESPYLEGLRSLCLGANPLSAATKERLSARFGERVST